MALNHVNNFVVNFYIQELQAIIIQECFLKAGVYDVVPALQSKASQ